MNLIALIVGWRSFARHWVKHRHTDNAAALAFYSLVSLAPVLLFGVTVAGMILGQRAAHGELDLQLNALVGKDVTELVDGMLQGARIAPHSQPTAFVIAMVTLLYSGSHVLTKLQQSLNLVNDAGQSGPPQGWLGRLFARGLCASLILLFGVLLVAGTMLEGVAVYITAHVDSPWFSQFNLQKTSRWLVTYVLLMMAFTLVLKILPRRRPMWRHAVVGAAFGALATASLKEFLDVYLRHSLWATIIGSGLTAVLFLLWLFLSIQAFLAGAEIAAWLGRRRAGALRRAALPPPPESPPPD